MKRLFAILLCMIFVLLTACGTPTEDERAETVTVHTKMKARQDTSNIVETVRIKTDPSDPYSYYIKDKYEKIYAAQIKKGSEYFLDFDKYAGDPYYFIYDINGDGTDEMIMGDWIRTTIDVDDADPPKKVLISNVYTVKDGEVVKLSGGFWWEDDYIWNRVLLTNGVIQTTDGHEDYPNYSFMAIENGELKLKCRIQYTSGGYFRIYDTQEKEVITKEEFESLRDESIGDATPVEIEWKRIDEYGQ